MAYARGSGRDISYIKEVTPGTTPALPAMIKMRTTGDSFNLNRDSFQSDELRADRAITDMKLGNKQASGNIDFELSYENFEDMLEAVLESPDTLTIPTDVIKNGTTQTYFTIEKGFPGVPHFQVYTGMTPNTFNLNLQSNSQVTATIEFLGLDQSTDTVSIADSVVEPTLGGLFDSYTGEIKEGGATIGDITSLTMTINNNLTPTFVLMNDAVSEIIDGRCNIEGTLSVYFADATLYNKFASESESSIEFTLTVSGSTDGYTFLLPRVKYTAADMPVADEGPVTVTMPFQALQDNVVENATIKITKN